MWAERQVLANLNVTGQNYGLVLAPIILHQLPHGVRLEWARSAEGKEGDVEYLLHFLYEEIQRRERSSQLDSSAEKTPKPGTTRRPVKTTGSGLLASGGDASGAGRTTSCSFCRQPHYSDRCPSIRGLTADQKKDKVKVMRLCFRCLSDKHTAKDCAKTCYLCKGSHHRVLHRQQQRATGVPTHHRPNGGAPQSRDPHQVGSPNTPPFVPGSYVAANTCPAVSTQMSADSHQACYSQSSGRGKSTLMQVVRTHVGGHPLNVLFDSGSDFSYIREDAAKRLKLVKVGSQCTTIAAFGGTIHKDHQHQVYGLNIGGVTITVLGVKVISQPLFRPPVPIEVLGAFKDINVTEDLLNESNFEIDMLVGLDHYHELIGQNSVRAGNGLVAQHTKLGWMVSGSYPSTNNKEINKRMTALFSRSEEPSDATIRRLWELDAIGIQNNIGEESLENNVLINFEKGVTFENDRYKVGLPWKVENLKERLMSNLNGAHKRLTEFGKEIVHWKNICPLSPNWGGWWERLVRSVKSSLKKSLGRQTVARIELETILPEIEACVNSRPLIYVAEKGKILTPSHFLIGRATPLTSAELENFGQVINLSARDEFEESLTEQFWQIWKSEYLRNLPPLTLKSKKSNNCLELDTVVLIVDEKKPRMWWVLGKVVKLYKGIDGKVRAVQLKTQKGLITRSINHICLLEDSSSDPLTADNAVQLQEIRAIFPFVFFKWW
ncbi:hypothetical protein EGW08_016443 [Elysia chlorotica]|uniref:Peptidase A2 domain-containing protein n=1 Tax=Elysia chlorotica TaxID=188477 RepID=A0A433T2K8_ELYCH|nr:hypothetical protein EGW08_016443 [Elysia chlorotica]